MLFVAMSQKLISDCFPLSPMQQGMLFHFLKEPRSGVDIEQVVVHLPEPIDASRLRAAWEWLIRRHDILRARFLWESVDQPQQEILDDILVPFEVRQVGNLSTSAQKGALDDFLKEDRVAGFDLNSAPLLRLTLFQWAESSSTLVWTFHHALLDGRSYPKLLAEVFEAYSELATGGIAPRPGTFSYRRYIDWLQEQDFARAQEFWKEYLKGFSAPTPLVVQEKAPSTSRVIACQQGEAWEILSSKTTADLRAMASTENLSMNSLLMAGWAILLHRYSGETDVVFGATRACRKSSVADADETIGIFINTVPVRVQFTGESSLMAVLKDVRRQWLDLRSYEHSPLALVKSASQVPAALPLFETLLVFENYRLDTAMTALGGDWMNRRVELHELTNFPVTIAAYDGAELSLKIEFDRHRISEPTAKRMLGHLHRLLQGIAANPAVAVRDLELVTDLEFRELVEEFNIPEHAACSRSLPLHGGATLHTVFEEQARQRPESIALVCDGRSLTYVELNRRANQIARQLIKFGVGPDTLVGLCLERSNELVIGLLAILKAGGAYLPIDLAYPAERLRFILDDARAPVLLTQRSLVSNLPATNAEIICVEEILAAETRPGAGENLDIPVTPDHLAYAIYTSGTTGKPKGTLITHRNVVRLFASTEQWYAFTPNDVWTLFHSAAFDFSVWEIWGALLYGGRLVVVPFLVSRSPESFFELLLREKVTVLNQTPSAFRTLIQAEASAGQADLALRYVIFGGEALEMQSLKPWFDRHGDQNPLLINMYGITETTVHVTYRPLSRKDLDSGSVVGVPIPDLQIYILDSQKRPVPIGIPGEMYVGGAGLARGYLRRPELTAQKFIANHLSAEKDSRLYRTGDLARFLPGREIEYLGRIDDQVKIRGFRIELGEIESVLVQHPSVREVSVIAREDIPGSKRLVAYLTTTEPPPELNELREHLKKKVPDYMVPAAFLFLDRFPLTNNGKIDRKALPVPEQQRVDVGGKYVAPRSPAEAKLAAVWAKVLRIEKVGVHDNFFELGGDSILSIQVIALARREDIKLTPKLLFANQTVAELALAAESAADANTFAENLTGEFPLSPIQKWFFEQDLADAHHYNQAFLFEVSEHLDPALLERALREVNRHHDALRLRIKRAGGKFHQSYSQADEKVTVVSVDLTGIAPDEQRAIIDKSITEAQAVLSFATGPIWRVIHFAAGDSAHDKLFVVVHHLAVDGISWRPLLEDIESAYTQLQHGANVALPPKTTSFKRWSELLQKYAPSQALQSELTYWNSVVSGETVKGAVHPFMEAARSSSNTEGAAEMLKNSLTADETTLLLQKVPATYNTRINDVLLTALAEAWRKTTGDRALFTNLEGHGRENLFDDTDLSRTVGWFTSIFPVRIELSPAAATWHPGEALKAVKEQLRQIPNHGIGFAVLRYLNADSGLPALPEPPIVFNYLGQFDQVLSSSRMFKFARQTTGAWHSPKQRRRSALEVNSMVIDGRLELSWTYSSQLNSAKQIENLAAEFLDALRQIIRHCAEQISTQRTPADFPLANLDQSSLDLLTARCKNVEDVYPLSPVQTLFFSANPERLHHGFDQWQCSFSGQLDVAAFQEAWKQTLLRHTILRTSIQTENLREALQVVHSDVSPNWLVEDRRSVPFEQSAAHWADFLKQDATQPIDLSQAPMMRFALIRIAADRWKFLWSVPALLLDGWSWPIVFREASRLYESLQSKISAGLEPVRPYREYLQWLRTQSSEESARFWRNELAGFREPTGLPGSEPEVTTTQVRFAKKGMELSEGSNQSLQSAARSLQVTLNSIVQGAWALLLGRQNSSADVLFGSAFSGRPTDLPGAESIVGPFVNAVPVRVAIDEKLTAADFFRTVHRKLIAISFHQFTPLLEIQKSSEVPEWRRLFESLIVFQNYAVDGASRQFGGALTIADFDGPIHTNYPVLLLAEPGETLKLTLIYDTQVVAHATIERWAQDFTVLLENLGSHLENSVQELQVILSKPVMAGARPRRKLSAETRLFAPPQTEMERSVAAIWQKMFELPQVSIDENFFDLGGHSLLVVRMHKRLEESLKLQFPVVALFEHPTIRSLAHNLSNPTTQAGNSQTEKLQDRAQQQKRALSQMRVRLKR